MYTVFCKKLFDNHFNFTYLYMRITKIQMFKTFTPVSNY